MKLSKVRKVIDDCPNCETSTWLVIYLASKPNKEKWICQDCGVAGICAL